METGIATTPFGRRPMSLAMLAAQNESREIPKGRVVEKWQVYRNLCEGKSIVGIGDRALAVLNALLSFYPDSELSEENGLIVFPSNAQLSLRAHGMPDATVRRHLAALVDCGLILRRDSPNGKRYARKGRGGDIEEAFGFSLAPLLARACEFEAAAERVRADNRALRLMRERITLHRRDIHKLIEAAVEEDVPGDWGGLWRRFRAIVEGIPRRACIAELEPIVAGLAGLHEDVDKLLEIHMNSTNPSANDSQNERQQSDSNTDSIFEFEPAFERSGATAEPSPPEAERPKGYPLGLVLKACPEIIEYAVDGIANWRDLMEAAAQVRGYLGVSPSAYGDACLVMGRETASIVIACILQRAQHINSAGGYLRVLTEKARAGQFSVGPMLMAALKAHGSTSRMTG
ncbi:MAG: replication initiation protein RepC [Mesorhizobium sp.]|uniref:plasmid replication protein RepC n=3 Tax=Mesorhizobium TaxID=68287 RepID=UPI000FD407D9|nr:MULTISPECIES: plasmid replication protein RepC [unclassified Mesorhizobium]MCT2581108.1 plasmid replication protein RepC [Mesorhizobium sp. P13.3]MDF3170132.1 plasmid replication protein RepC [Mesorhizobium sp. P16.1]MDF3181078.1 plasmid replication protein RepC [Mesorhizobium sp. P17.1]MDF3187021.1 plasmid replication protein RepC [Mesorhizobium sp. ICCV3110.1]RUV68001.1 replication initiation protein RepC [Mesorhizobium sp. M1A.F.Ca.IN.020.30.1.1]